MCYHYCVVSTCISQTQFLCSIYSLYYISKISHSEDPTLAILCGHLYLLAYYL